MTVDSQNVDSWPESGWRGVWNGSSTGPATLLMQLSQSASYYAAITPVLGEEGLEQHTPGWLERRLQETQDDSMEPVSMGHCTKGEQFIPKGQSAATKVSSAELKESSAHRPDKKCRLIFRTPCAL